jgi:hypothetical protein
VTQFKRILEANEKHEVFKDGRTPSNYTPYHQREPAIGRNLDSLLYKDVIDCREIGLTVNDEVLFILLRVRLFKEGVSGLLRENGKFNQLTKRLK